MSPSADPDPKTYSPREERLNVLTHGAGALAVLFLLAPVLIVKTDFSGAALIYLACLTALLGGSALYHAARPGTVARARLRRFDHSAIFLLIAGTYTPLMTRVLATPAAYWVLGAEWLLAGIGITLELRAVRVFRHFQLLLYVAMGWLCAALLPQLVAAMPKTAVVELVAGGVAYTAGAAVYALKREYAHAVWHVLVLIGAGLHYLAILGAGS